LWSKVGTTISGLSALGCVELVALEQIERRADRTASKGLVAETVSRLEGRVHGAALPGHAAGLGGTIRQATLPRAAAQFIARQFAATFKEFPPAQKAASFTIDDALDKMNDAVGGAGH
jgi:hypothetical protein